MNLNPDAKCHFCDRCDGRGCIGELPGMGGVYGNENFIGNCADWAQFHGSSAGPLPSVRLAPITGALQNVGYHDERAFYHDLIGASAAAGVLLSIGDGYPDEKLKYGIEALGAIGRRGAVFIKPYENKKVLERMDWAADVSEIVGIDIDSYAILTMRNLVNLERKTAAQLLELKASAAREGKPFAIKGIFRPEDVELVEAVRPDVAVVSNHGGRVETLHGSTANFLALHGKVLAANSGEVWVDGGVRRRADLVAAWRLGASCVMIGRPFISALLRSREDGIRNELAAILG